MDPTPRSISIYDAIGANRVRTVLLIGIFVVFVVVVGFVLGEYFAPGGGLIATPIALGISVFSAAGSYMAGDKIVLGMSKARRLADGEEPQLQNIVEGLVIGAGLPMPALYLIDDSAPNAFATGRDPKHASIAVTRGLLDKLDRTEQEGVLAHELSHIGNYDIRVMILVTVLVGTVALLADFLLRSMWFGGGRRRGRNRDGGGGGILAIVAIALAILTPVIAMLIQLSISRQREYLADASGALLTRYPPGLASALRKIAADKEPLEVANKATAALYILNPLKDRPVMFDGLFDTHPPIAERIKRLESM